MFIGRHIFAFIRLGRPLFLVGGFVMHALGVAVAIYSGAGLNVRLLILGQIAITATQWMTHYSNDYFDLDSDRANATPTHWAGGSRVLVEGLLPPRVSLIAAIVLGLIAVSIAVWLGLTTRPLALPLIGIELILATAYSTPPMRLHSRGFGEITAAVVTAVLVPLTGFALQTGQITLLALLATVPVFLMQLAMLIGVAFPDAASDALTGKRTLVVRLGSRSVWLYGLVLVLAYGLLPVLMILGFPVLAAGTVLAGSPLALWQLFRVWRGAWLDPARQDVLAFGGVALLILTAVLEVVGFLAASG